MNSPAQDHAARVDVDATEAPDPSVVTDNGGYQPPLIAFSNGRSITLKTRKANARRGIIGGKRKLTMFDEEGGNSILIRIDTGKSARAQIRMTRDAFEALVDLYDNRHAGDTVWRFICRTAEGSNPALRDQPRDTSEGGS